MIDRRSFLERLGITGGALIAAGSSWGCADAEQPMPETRGAGSTGESPAPLRILILGGTGFIGPHQVEYARSRGHTLTLFNRGRTNTGLFPNVERLVGDRNGDVTALEGREWDVVLDNSGSRNRSRLPLNCSSPIPDATSSSRLRPCTRTGASWVRKRRAPWA